MGVRDWFENVLGAKAPILMFDFHDGGGFPHDLMGHGFHQWDGDPTTWQQNGLYGGQNTFGGIMRTGEDVDIEEIGSVFADFDRRDAYFYANRSHMLSIRRYGSTNSAMWVAIYDVSAAHNIWYKLPGDGAGTSGTDSGYNLDRNTPHTMGWSFDKSDIRVFVDGSQLFNVGYTFALNYENTDVGLMTLSTDTTSRPSAMSGFNGLMKLVLYTPTVLTDDQFARLNDDPYGCIQPRHQTFYSFPTAGGENVTLTADAGSYTLTGTAADLFRGINVSATAGSYTVTGAEADLLKAFKLAAESGSFAIAGTGAGVTHDHNLAAAAGAFSITGMDAALLFGLTLGAESGSFTIAGNAASVLYDRTVAAVTGALTLTGADVAMALGVVLGADAGAFAITGSAASLTVSRVLAAIGSGFTLTGFDATLIDSGSDKVLTANAGSFTITGTAAGIQISRKLSIESGSLTLSGAGASLLFDRILASESGSLTITGQGATLIEALVLSAGAGEFSLTGSDVTLTYSGYVLPNGKVAITFSVKQPGATLTISQPSITISGR